MTVRLGTLQLSIVCEGGTISWSLIASSAASGFVHTNRRVCYDDLNHSVHSSLGYVSGRVNDVIHLCKEKLNLIKIAPYIQCHVDARLCW